MTDWTRLHALADEELSAAEAAAVREEIKSDPSAALEVDAVLNLKDLLAKNSLRHSDDEVWKTCLVRLDGMDKSRRVEGFVGRYAWALCGAMFVLILSGRYAMRNVQGDNARTADLARVFGGSSAALSPEVKAQSKMYSDLTQAIGRSLDAKELQIFAPAFGQVHDMAAARYPVRDRLGDLSLVQVDGTLNMQDTSPLSANPRMESGVINGINCVVWHKGGQTWLLTGDRPVEELSQVADRISAAR